MSRLKGKSGISRVKATIFQPWFSTRYSTAAGAIPIPAMPAFYYGPKTFEDLADFIAGRVAAEDYLADLQRNGRRYNGFNLVAGRPESLCYYGNRGPEPRAIAPGIHGLSNHLMDTPWPKVERACQAMGARELEAHAQGAIEDNVTIEPVYCLGNCACAPAVMIDGKTYGRVDAERYDALLQMAREALR